MDLITTHVNSDFDGLSSLVAARKLYPDARLLLPGSREKAVRDFLSLIKDKIPVESDKTCRLDDVDRLVIVDNRHASRIGIARALAAKEGVDVHIYDHHPRTDSDLKGSKDVFKEVGATVSILLEILEDEDKLDLTPLEATLMLLGIYEETGSLSYSTTTKLDVEMVGKLLGMGANLNVVSSYLNRNLEGKELNALIELLESTEITTVNGINVAFCCVEAGHVQGEMGTVVHKLQDVENYPVLFAMFRSDERIKILARSRFELIDVNKLLSHFNGAGHSSAASAKIEGKSLDAVKGQIIELLDGVLRPEVFARDIMSRDVLTFSQDEKVADVMVKLERLGYEGAPVVTEEGELVGVIALSDLKKALKQDMGHSRIKGYMASGARVASPNTPIHELRAIITREGIGRLPIMEGAKMLGIVTRTDVLKEVHSMLFPSSGEHRESITDLSDKMKELLPEKLMEFITFIGAEADILGMRAFLVGGFVRDILLGKSRNYDLDVVVEGDAISFGRIIADKIGGALVVHNKFGTSTVVRDWPKWLGESLHPENKFKVDIATARKEFYEEPAALPTVEFSSLKEDLYRRDFTINAMAVNINKEHFGLFVDFFGGRKDLEKGSIRALHDQSFIDDPTRIFRAVRFEQRFGFTIESHTEYLIKHAVKQEMFKRTENQRIRDELKLMLKEDSPDKAVFRMQNLHELRFIHPDLSLPRSIKTLFSKLRENIEWYETSPIKHRKLDKWLMYLILVLGEFTEKQMNEVVEKFVFTRGERLRLLSSKNKAPEAVKRLSSSSNIKPSQIYGMLEPLSHEVILCMLTGTRSGKATERIHDFFEKYNGMKLSIKGQDIKNTGIEPGPEYRQILREILFEKLDGNITTHEEEMDLMNKKIKKMKEKDHDG